MSEAKPKLLIVDDDKGIQRQLRWSFDDYQVAIAGDRDQAIAKLRYDEPSVVTLDLGLPPDPDGVSEGFATLEYILKLAPDTKVIVATGNEDHEHALRAVAMGAYDYYKKPIDSEELAAIVMRAFHLFDLEEENRQLLQNRRNTPLSGLLTSSTEMLSVCRLIERVAGTGVSVLLLCESGTGKEILARALHELSDRVAKPFCAINCAAIPENLMEAELFGHEKGAFTGAIRQSKGKIELADQGTLFLDEIGDVPLTLQVKLLRFLQERVIERIGGRQQIAVDVRIVCATHQNLEQMIIDGTFREDLYYRLSEMVVRIPALSERVGDPELLANSFVQRFAAEQGRPIRGFTPEAMRAIAGHPWPGNVRELENRVKRAVIMCDGKRIMPEDLDLAVTGDAPEVLNLSKAREEAERREIPRALSRSDGNISQAAKLLGVSRPTLYDLMRHHGIRAD